MTFTKECLIQFKSVHLHIAVDADEILDNIDVVPEERVLEGSAAFGIGEVWVQPSLHQHLQGKDCLCSWYAPSVLLIKKCVCSLLYALSQTPVSKSSQKTVTNQALTTRMSR